MEGIVLFSRGRLDRNSGSHLTTANHLTRFAYVRSDQSARRLMPDFSLLRVTAIPICSMQRTSSLPIHSFSSSIGARRIW